MSVEALPALAPGAIPAAVRQQGAAAVAGFETALGFERTLLTQMLNEALPKPEAGADPREASLPGTMADAIVAQGGLGLAASSYASFEPR